MTQMTDARRAVLRTARPRHVSTVVSLIYVGVVVRLFGDIPLKTFNILLATTAVPLVWLIWAFARFSAHQHANRWAKDVAKVHGGRPVRVGERVR